MSFSRVGNIAHAVDCLHNWQPTVGTVGTCIISTNGIINSAICRLLHDIDMQLVHVPMVGWLVG